ncbi:O-antigen ligase family protein [Marinomonas sp. IMCC 4694]|uniref:O-antigen ligase family protein n=1 Tax=Marinomonas sp. IMCC 4694 TaxID=2605432 RepID=UPI0011E71995|nr:O-antigen ligase family protein [Marinomonas sp. IMCC 4694]TYL46855.1 hypothetical protein FXV75_02245 [Marinomonas sp. IMCC 4694]
MTSSVTSAMLKSFYFIVFMALVFLISNPIPISIAIAVLSLVSIAFLFSTNNTPIQLDRYGKLFVVVLSAYLVSKIAPFVSSGFIARYLSPGFHMLVSLPIFLVLWKLSRDTDGEKPLINIITIAAALGSFGGLAVAYYQTQVLGMGRADGFLFSINFGFLAGTLFAISLGLVGKNRLSVLSFLSCVAALGSIMLSGSRGALFPLLFVLIAWLLFSFKHLPKRYLVVILVLAIATPYFAYKTSPFVKARLDTGLTELKQVAEGDVFRSGSLIARVQLWIAATHAYEQSPVFGLTYPEREQLNKTLVDTGEVVPWVGTVRRGHAHSQYFETLATGGLVGMFCLAVYLFAPMVIHLRFLVTNSTNVYARTGFLFTLSVAGFGLTEVLLQQEMIATYYAFMQTIFFVFAYRQWQGDKTESQ